MSLLESLVVVRDTIGKHDGLSSKELATLLDEPIEGLSYRELKAGVSLLEESGVIVRRDNQYFINDLGVSDVEAAVTSSIVKSLTSNIDESFPSDGIVEINENQDMLFYSAFIGRRFRYTVPYLVDFGLVDLDIAKRQILIKSGSEIYQRIIFSIQGDKRRKSIESLMNDLEKKRLIGELAERRAFEFEKKRLRNLKIEKEPILISSDYVNAGYDMESYELDEDRPTRFIEVKAMTDADHFFLSINEVSKSKSLKKNYYLYLVNLGSNLRGTEVSIIQDPYKYFFEAEQNDWLRLISGYEFKKINIS